MHPHSEAREKISKGKENLAVSQGSLLQTEGVILTTPSDTVDGRSSRYVTLTVTESTWDLGPPNTSEVGAAPMGNKWAPIVSSVRCRWLGSPGEIYFALESRKHCRRDCHRKVTDPVGLTRSRLGHGNGAGCVGPAGLSIWGAVLRAATQITIIHCTSNVQRPTGATRELGGGVSIWV